MINPKAGLIGDGDRDAAEQYGLLHIGQYAHDVSQALQIEPPEGITVTRKVGLLNNRPPINGQPDPNGETVERLEGKIEVYGPRLAKWYAIPRRLRTIAPKPKFPWFKPDVGAIWAAEAYDVGQRVLQEMETGNRSLWVPGCNEPNGPLAHLDPELAADLWLLYQQQIKGLDPAACVMGPELFLTDAIPVAVRDRATDILLRRGYQEANAAFESLLKSKGLRFLDDLLFGWDEAVIQNTIKDILNMFRTRVFGLTTPEYFQRFIDALPEDCPPDALTFHVYPFWDPAGSTSLEALLETASDAIQLCRAKAAIKWGKWLPVRITEFGNPSPELDEAGALEVLKACVEHFESLDYVAGYHFYKFRGRDKQLPEDLQPFSCLSANGELNSLGRDYFGRAGVEI